MSQVKPYIAMGKKKMEGSQSFCQPRLQSNTIKNCTNSTIGKTWKWHENFPLLPHFPPNSSDQNITLSVIWFSNLSYRTSIFVLLINNSVPHPEIWDWVGGKSGKRKEFFKGNKVVKAALSSSWWHFTFFPA